MVARKAKEAPRSQKRSEKMRQTLQITQALADAEDEALALEAEFGEFKHTRAGRPRPFARPHLLSREQTAE